MGPTWNKSKAGYNEFLLWASLISYLDGCYNQSLVHKRVQGIGVGLSEISCKVGPHARVPHSNFDQALFSELNDLKVKVRPENKMDLDTQIQHTKKVKTWEDFLF